MHGQASGPGADYLALLAAQRPLLPQPLRWFFGRQAARFNAALSASVAGHASRRVLHLPAAMQRNAAGLMAEDGFHLFRSHAFKQTCADRNECAITAHACGKRVGFGRVEHAHFRHADAQTLRLFCNGLNQPGLGLIAG